MNKENMWDRYEVTWTFVTKVCAGTPADPELVRKWLDARKPKVEPPSHRSIDEIQAEVIESLGEIDEEQSQLLVFQRNKGRLCMRASTIKAHMKDCSRVISARVGRLQGEAAFSTKIINGTYPDHPGQYWVPFQRMDGSFLTVADGEEDKPIHVKDTMGRPKNALTRFEWVYGVKMVWELWGMNGWIHQSDLETLYTYGGVHGYASQRGDGEGKYTFEINQLGKEKFNGKGRKEKTQSKGQDDRRDQPGQRVNA